MEVEVETVSASPVTEAAAKAYNTFRDEVSMPGPRVAPPEPLVEDKTAKAKTEKKVVNPHTQKPYYKDNRHTLSQNVISAMATMDFTHQDWSIMLSPSQL